MACSWSVVTTRDIETSVYLPFIPSQDVSTALLCLSGTYFYFPLPQIILPPPDSGTMSSNLIRASNLLILLSIAVHVSFVTSGCKAKFREVPRSGQPLVFSSASFAPLSVMIEHTCQLAELLQMFLEKGAR